MNSIAKAFEKSAKEERATLIIYLCAGDPDLKSTEDLVVAISEAGADIIELGVPFSDPTADGEVIQKASERALKAGTTLRNSLETVRAVRNRGITTPILLFGYYNPLFHYGEAAIVKDAKAAGVDGFLVVDLPPEQPNELYEQARAQEMAVVPLVAPTSTEARKEAAARACNAFLYYVSLTGVTGAQTADLAQAAKHASDLSKRFNKPVAVGFGIKDKQDAQTVAALADGVVVGSAVVKLIAACKESKVRIDRVKELVSNLRKGVSRQN